MLQKPPDKLMDIQAHTFLHGIRLVIFVAEGDFVVFKSFDPVI